MSGSTTFEEPLGFGARVPTRLFTRHMLGVIELDRDRRRRRRAGMAGPTTRHDPVHSVVDPRIAAAFTPEARAAAVAALDIDRWADEGGSFDAEAAALDPALSR